jgi:hypothetical protein
MPMSFLVRTNDFDLKMSSSVDIVSQCFSTMSSTVDIGLHIVQLDLMFCILLIDNMYNWFDEFTCFYFINNKQMMFH